jgi:hypothetical protein
MRRKMTMRRKMVDWFFGMEDALILNGTTRTGLVFGFVGDVLAGQKPLVLQAWSAWRLEDQLLSVSRNMFPRQASVVRNTPSLLSDIFSSWKRATPSGFARSQGPTLNRARPSRGPRASR